MRLCIVSREYVPFSGGGIGTFATQYAEAFAAAGHEVHVLTGPHAGVLTRGPALQPAVHFHVVDLTQGPAALDAFVAYPQRYALGVYETLKRLHAETPFEYVEFPDFWGEGCFALQAHRLLGEFDGAVMAVRLHTPSREVRRLNNVAWLDTEGACLDFLEDEALRQCDVVLSPTHSLLELVRARLDFHQPTAVIAYPFTEQLTPGPTEPASGRARVLYFGRLEHRKGVQLLVPAVAALLDTGLNCELQLIGADTDTGPFGESMKQHLQRLIPARHHGRFVFEPSRPRAELTAAIRSAAVCCFPSVWENFPNVCLEAMAQGALVVGSDAGGMAEIIEDGVSGLLFKSGDLKSLIATLRRALTEPAVRAQAATAAPARIAAVCEPKAVVTNVLDVVARQRRKAPRKTRRGARSPEVSVLVPLFNLGHTLPDTLRSLKAQSFTSLEVIVVDDGSTDPATRKLLEAGGLDAPGLTVLRQEHRGVSAARNTALGAARGRWVLPVDPDDVLSPDFVQTMVAALAAEPRLTFATSFASFFEVTPEQATGGWAPWGLERPVLPAMNVASSCSALMQRAHVEDAGGWDEWLPAYEDWDLFCSFAEAGRLGAVIPKFLFFYRVRPDSLMRTVVEQRHYRLLSHLVEKHPMLSTDWARTSRLFISQAARLDHAPTGLAEAEPLRYRLADGLNDFVKGLPLLHPALRRAAALTAAGGFKATAERVRKKLQRG